MRIFLSALVALTILCVTSVSTFRTQPTSQVHAASVTDLQKQKQALEQQAKLKAEQARQEEDRAKRAASKLSEITSEIRDLEKGIADTNNSISSTQDKIAEQNQQIAGLESELRKIKDQQDVLVRRLYIEAVAMKDEYALLANKSVSDREREEAQFLALKKSVSILHARTMEAKMAIEKSRGELLARNQELTNLRDQQANQRRGLADYQGFQASIKQDAEAAMKKYDSQAQAARLQGAKIEQQIAAALTAAINARRKGTITATGGYGGGVGSRVRRGDVIGRRGSSGFSSGPHVHFEVRRNGNPVDPSGYLSNGTLMWPVSNYTLSQGFGWTEYARSGAYGGSIHTGLDLAGPAGDPVYAPADGVVILKQYYGGYGYAWAQELDNGLVVLQGHLLSF